MKKTTTDTALKTALGPLYKLFNDPAVYCICIDSFDDVYYYDNTGAKTTKLFKTRKELETMISRLIKYSGKTLKPDMQTLFLSFGDFIRMNIVFPPVAIKGPAILVTKLPVNKVTLDDLIKYEALDGEGKKIIEDIIAEGKGVLVAGRLGSGKTTLLNTLLEAIPLPQRVVTLERFSDLVVHRPKVFRLQSQYQHPNEMVELVGIAERMYADYVVISNFTGPEVMPFLELIRNNVSGMGLITGDNPLDALKRLETKAVISSEGMSLEDARYAISQSMQTIVFQEKRTNGKRVVSFIGEIQFDSGELKLKTLYKR